MVGFFQLFGISFLFWTMMGVLRFIFDSLEALAAPRDASRGALIASSIAGIALSIILAPYLWYIFGLMESAGATPLQEELTFLAVLWMFAVTFGAYCAVRIYAHSPFVVSAIVGFSVMLLGLIALSVWRPQMLASDTILIAAILFAQTSVPAAAIGGFLANRVNQWQDRRRARFKTLAKKSRIRPHEVAIVIAAHNEEITIGTTLESILAFADPANVYIGSDGSSDKTVEVVKSFGCQVIDIQPNGGKSKALTTTLERFDILDRYKAVFFVDADIKINEKFLEHALALFNDEKVVAVIGHAVSLWPKHMIPQWRLFFTAYRIRLWRVLQFCIRYGQTWRHTSMTPIIPGGGSIYRTTALRKIRIHVPGLIIEDFNMTFEVHHKKLGKIGFDHRAFVLNQEPFSLRDYIKQISRWYIGFFQTLRLHGIWPSLFLFATVFFTLELLVGSLIFIALPFIAINLLLMSIDFIHIPISFGIFEMTLVGIVFTVFVLDLLVTAIVAIIEKKPLLVVYGVGFYLLRYVESIVFLYALVQGLMFRPTQEGKWKSPQRVSYSTY